MAYDFDMISKFYGGFQDKIAKARELANRSLTLAEKILYSHVAGMPGIPFQRGKDYALLNPDRVAMQDATAQMALLQFMQANMKSTAVPATVHTDHLIEVEVNAKHDLDRALKINAEVYAFLESVAVKYGIGFWKPGAGIIHQIILENYAFPGGLMIGTDSHTPNTGGMAMLGIGVGGADAVDVMVGIPWELKWPHIYGVRLIGELKGWASPKDVILELLGRLTVKGGTGAIFEYFGEGTKNLSTTGKATITNMGAELGATTSVFPFDSKHDEYLRATNRADVALLAEKYRDDLVADPDVMKRPEKYFDKIVEIDLSKLEPHLNGPFTPDKSWAVSSMPDAVKENGYPEELSAALIGSCTNASYEDIDKAAQVAKFAMERGIKAKSKVFISPGSDSIRATLERDGQLEILREFGAEIFANACGPCIGMWNRRDVKNGVKNSIVTTFNRNFAKRADGNPETYAFVAGAETAIALAAAGRITFDPSREVILNDKGEQIMLVAPSAHENPSNIAPAVIGIAELAKNTGDAKIVVDPASDRLQLLTPFEAWNGKDFTDCAVLIKVKGKCTTDHISPAGPWLKYRGHLDNISNNMLTGAVNAFNDKTGEAYDTSDGQWKPVPQAARNYLAKGVKWVVIGDENIGEGSSREHAAMEIRHLGGIAVIARSFARIHETNLKKQGILALTFADPADYEKIRLDDRVNVTGLKTFKPGEPLKLEIRHADGATETAELHHTFSEAQIEWFEAGSALNLIAAAGAKK